MVHRHVEPQLPDVEQARRVVLHVLARTQGDVEELDGLVVVANDDAWFRRALVRAGKVHRGEHDGVVDRTLIEGVLAFP